MSNVVELPTWRNELGKGDKNQVLATTANAMLFIAYAPVLRGLVAWDDLANRPVITRAPPAGSLGTLPGPYPRTWDAADVHCVLGFLEQTETSAFKLTQIEGAMHAVAALNRFHPVRAYLAGLAWDGYPRVDRWLVSAFGAVDSAYTRAVGRSHMIAAVRRVREPGTKHDAMPVLDGAQGIGKSRAIRALHGAEWTTDYLPTDLGGKDAAQALAGVWCVEMAEVDHLIRAEPETVKAFLSRQVDRYRPPYSRNVIESPRQAVIIGTSNRDDYLRDDTGNRRFWPVKCQFADVGWVADHRDQLWAEAVAYAEAGQPHWLPDDVLDEAAQLAADNVIEDTWDDAVRAWLKREGQTYEVTTAVVLTEALAVPRERQDRKTVLRAVACLRRAGWQQERVGRGNTCKRVWVRR
jgi:predicted P-loop ATPase